MESCRGNVINLTWGTGVSILILQATVLASASYDRTIAVYDARSVDAKRVSRYALPSDSESLQWNVHNPAQVCDGRLLQ